MLLINTTTRHAFYQVRRIKSNVVIRFGRLGTAGITKKFEFADARSAKDFAAQKVTSKIEDRNYELVLA
jgi:predicted DNA-binding WGR domain protein